MAVTLLSNLGTANTATGKATTYEPKRARKQLARDPGREARVREAKESGEFDDLRSMFNQQSMAAGTGKMMTESGDIVDRDYGSMPKQRARSVMRGKNEHPDDFKARKAATMMPRGLGRGGGLDAYYAMQDRNLTADEANMKASMIRAEGGRINRDGSMSKAVSPPSRSSTGSEYDPVANRRMMMQTGRAAVQERKNLQKSDQELAQMRQDKIWTPGYENTVQTPYGSASIKQFKKGTELPPGKVTVGRYRPDTQSIQNELNYLRDRQKRRGMPDLPPLKA